jgi:hypothetical protein
MEIKINALEVACELATEATKNEMLFVHGSILEESEMYVSDGENTEILTEEAQEVFNRWYDFYLNNLIKYSIN